MISDRVGFYSEKKVFFMIPLLRIQNMVKGLEIKEGVSWIQSDISGNSYQVEKV